MKISAFAILLFSSIFIQCKAVVPADSTLKKAVSFPLGAAVKVDLIKNNPVYRNILIKEFNSITPENAMKMGAVHPSKDLYTFAGADYIVAFAQENGIRVHGHTLNWPLNNPAWITNFKGDSTAWEGLLKSHIQTIVRHFKGKVASWDVVNEAFDDNGKYKKSIWLEKLGVGYIARCFQYAHQADPNALLFYNDYGQEYSVPKRNAILKMVSDFKRQGVPIDGLGLQMHTIVKITDVKLATAIQVMAKSGLKIHISELEISVYNIAGKKEIDSKLAIAQGNKYGTVFKTFMSLPKSQQFGITTWNVGDKDSFRNTSGSIKDFPLLFDMNYKPKAAYKALLKSMQKLK